MESVIEYIKSYVTTCADCTFGREARCGFLLYDEKIPSVDNNPYMEDGIMKCSSEGKAFFIAAKRGNPCDNQMDTEQFIRHLEEKLELVEVPAYCGELLSLIGKLKRVNSIFRRTGDALSCAFEDIVQAAIDKCLARIDYHYLELGIDIGEAIKAISESYDRMLSLCDMYPEQIIQEYIKNAVIVGIADLTSSRGLITDVAHDLKLELELFGEEHQLGKRNLGYTAIKEFKWIFSDQFYAQLVRAILVEFGYALVAGVDPSNYPSVETVMQSYKDKDYGRYIRWGDLCNEISNSFSRNLFDKIQYLKVIKSLIGSTKEIAHYYYPLEEDEMHKEASVLLHFLSTIKAASYKPVMKIWHEAKQEAKYRMEQEDLSFDDYLDLLKRVAEDKAAEEGSCSVNNEFTILESLLQNLKQLALYISAELLRTYQEDTVEQLQEECGVKISDSISGIDLSLAGIMTLQEVENYKKQIYPNQENEVNSTKPGEVSENAENANALVQHQKLKDYPTIIDDIIKRLPEYYYIDGDIITFRGDSHKAYAIFLKELVRIVYKKKGHFNTPWKKLPIYPMTNGEIVTPEQLTQGNKIRDEINDSRVIEKARRDIQYVYDDIMLQSDSAH